MPCEKCDCCGDHSGTHVVKEHYFCNRCFNEMEQMVKDVGWKSLDALENEYQKFEKTHAH